MKKRRLTPFGLKVKNKLADLNMSQKDLAERLGTSDVYLSMILYGVRSGQIYIEKIRSILNMN
nr:helix-turn-helix transcriptional regulator [Sedimentibacter sp.]